VSFVYSANTCKAILGNSSSLMNSSMTAVIPLRGSGRSALTIGLHINYRNSKTSCVWLAKWLGTLILSPDLKESVLMIIMKGFRMA